MNFRVNNEWGSSYQTYPSIAVDGSGNFVITWWDFRRGNGNVYAQRYSSDGTKQGFNFRVNNDSGIKYQGRPDVKLINQHIYYTWEDNRIEGQGYDIFARVDMFSIARKLPIGYLSLHEIIDKMYTIAITHPQIAKVYDLTAKYNTLSTFEGRHIYAIKISDNVNAEEDEPDMLIVSNHHAREVVIR